MAWYDFFTPSSVAKHGRRLQDRDAQPDDRVQSAHWLAEQATPESLLALCRRFDLQLEHNIKDRTEKDAVIELLVDKGSLAVEPARAHARGSHNFQHSLRVIERIEGSTAATELLLELLGLETVENEFHPEKKRTLLLTLAERKDARVVDGATRFLLDFDEGVRHAAVEAIAGQEGDDGSSPLLAALQRRSEESTRVRGRVAEVIAARGWPVADDGWLADHLPSGFSLSLGALQRR